MLLLLRSSILRSILSAPEITTSMSFLVSLIKIIMLLLASHCFPLHASSPFTSSKVIAHHNVFLTLSVTHTYYTSAHPEGPPCSGRRKQPGFSASRSTWYIESRASKVHAQVSYAAFPPSYLDRSIKPLLKAVCYFNFSIRKYSIEQTVL